ncbi:MAG: DNA/RNA nuclease SfsA [Bacteroidetes bacterium 4572_77]|nr:MAG: DNA/RNA nuclease SfsA [Bacteroidetes bacterium 4572_77]
MIDLGIFCIRRYKRFLADIELEDGSVVVAHCTNTGSMKSLLEVGAPVLLSPASDPKRKTKFTWELIWINQSWAGVNTANANKIAISLLQSKQIKGLEDLQEIKAEVKNEDSRLDIFGKDKNGTEVWMEVKNVSMKEEEYALFPDAITTRGQKHLKRLTEIKKQGHRAAMIYIIQRNDVKYFGVAKHIDPVYAKLLEEAKKIGVEVYAVQIKWTKQSYSFEGLLSSQ